jgi:hypothetical protein
MKSKSNNETAVTITSTVRLTIGGQAFEMTVDELTKLHEAIGKALGKPKDDAILEMLKKIDSARPYRERPFPPIPPQWHLSPPMQRERPRYSEITCSALKIA